MRSIDFGQKAYRSKWIGDVDCTSASTTLWLISGSQSALVSFRCIDFLAEGFERFGRESVLVPHLRYQEFLDRLDAVEALQVILEREDAL